MPVPTDQYRIKTGKDKGGNPCIARVFVVYLPMLFGPLRGLPSARKAVSLSANTARKLLIFQRFRKLAVW